jgi:hypothetical protein
VQSKWLKKLSNNLTPKEMVTKLAATKTDKEICLELAKLGFATSPKAVRSMRIRLGITKSQTNTKKLNNESVHGDEWDITLGRTPISSQEELIAAYKVDTRIWEVVEFNISRYEVIHGAQAVGSGQEWERDRDDWTITPLNSIKAKLRKRPGVEQAIQELEAIKKSIKAIVPKPLVIKRVKMPVDNMLELCIPDVHFGKVAWGQQTLHGDYDVSIAKKVFQESVAVLTSRVESYKFGEILFVVGNDVFHTDNEASTTYAGTPLDSDTRYHRTFRIVREVMVNTIESLRSIAPVKVLVVPGNHDRMTAWHLGDSLECWFHRHKDVTIDNSPSSRKYHRWGNVFLLFTHGDRGKRMDYPTLMAAERAIDWGQTTFREIHTGDKHQVRVEEKFGVRVRILPSLSQEDSWHSDHMFVSNLKQAEAFVWNREQGLVGTALYTYQGEK